jgi:hypothetical protein
MHTSFTVFVCIVDYNCTYAVMEPEMEEWDELLELPCVGWVVKNGAPVGGVLVTWV